MIELQWIAEKSKGLTLKEFQQQVIVVQALQINGRIHALEVER